MLGWKKIYCAQKKRCFSGMSSLRHLNAYQLRYTDPPKCVHFFGWSIRPDVFVIFFWSHQPTLANTSDGHQPTVQRLKARLKSLILPHG